MKKFAKKDIEDILSLTPMQQGMLFHYLKEPESDLYYEQLSLEISGSPDITLFYEAWRVVTTSNQMLRTLFRWKKMEKPIQLVLKEHLPQVRWYDCTGEHMSEVELLEEIRSKDRKEKFDLQEVPFRVTLCKLHEKRYEMIISHHHILYDGWSTSIIMEEFFNTYNDLFSKRKLLKPPKTAFKEFVKYIQGQDKDRQAAFWKKYLEGFDTRTPMPVRAVKPRAKRNGKEGSRAYSLRLRGDKKGSLVGFVQGYKVTFASLLYTAWAILLQTYNNSDDVLFGTTVSGRSPRLRGIEHMVGLFINTLPLRVQRYPDETVLGLLHRVLHTLQLMEEYESTPLVDIKEYMRWPHEEDLFDSLLVIENYPLAALRLKNSTPLTIHSYSLVEVPHYDLTLSIEIFNPDDVGLTFLYPLHLFDDTTIERLSGHLTRTLQNIVREPGKMLSRFEISTTEERQQILVDFNSTATDYPGDKTLHQLFAEQAEKHPHHMAVIAEDFRYHLHITYRQLDERANQLARFLSRQGVGPETVTGIMLHRSAALVCGILAILKAGSAYLPVDPDYPAERTSYMLKDSASKLLLTGGVYSQGSKKGVKIIDIEDERIYRGDTGSLPFVGVPNNPVYVIYTSGTTGRPRGVVVEHRNVVRLIKNTNYICFSPQDRLLQTGALEFDASTFEIWGTLLNGAGLVLVEKETILNPGAFKEVIRRYNIAIMWLTSPLFNQLADVQVFAGLRCLLVGGDVLSPPHINRVRKAFPQLKVINGYGPTENTTFSTTHWIDSEDKESDQKIPIGKPIANSSAFIADRYGNLQPIGIVGELYVGGHGVSRGYLNKPELSAEKFIPAPGNWLRAGSSVGKYLYKTGDLACWLPDGSIDFWGRIDFQVKIRGFRVELAEIEIHLLNHPAIKEAVVIARADKTGEHYLCAYVVSHSLPLASSPFPQTSQLHDYLAEKLPDYMVPRYFIFLEKLPLTSNGKLDRRALPEGERISSQVYLPPGCEREEALLDIWSEVLGIDRGQIGIDDNFFELGGHSLKAMGLAAHIHKTLGAEIPLEQIFLSPTVRELSIYIGQVEHHLHSPIEPVEKKEYYPLSSAQKRLYFLQYLDEHSTVYNVSAAMVLEGQVKGNRLADTFTRLIARHESLRTSFKMVAGEPVQRVHGGVDFEIEYEDTSSKQQALSNVSSGPLICHWPRSCGWDWLTPLKGGTLGISTFLWWICTTLFLMGHPSASLSKIFFPFTKVRTCRFYASSTGIILNGWPKRRMVNR